jgi:microcin C transport system substrate-binding protein
MPITPRAQDEVVAMEHIPAQRHPCRPRARSRAVAVPEAGPRRAGLVDLAAAGLIGAAVLLAAGRALAADPTLPDAELDVDVIVAHGVSAFGDLKYPPDFEHFDYVNPDAPQGGTMSFLGTGALNTFDTLNPWILQGNPAQGLGLLHDSLMVGSADEPDAMYGLIAESIEYPQDRSWAIFNLRPEARFSDGEPITAEDVVFTYEILLEKGRPTYRISLRDIESVEALDTHRVRFNFREGAETRDLPMLAAGLSILPKHYYEEVDFTRSTMTPPVSSGQFRVAEASVGRMIRYCKDPDYWGRDLPVNRGANNFDCYRYEYFADRTAAFQAFQVGTFLLHEENTASLWAEDYNFPAIQRGWVVRDEVEDGRPSGTQGFWINMRREKFQDIRVRQALNLLFNFEWTNRTFFHDLYERTTSFWQGTDMAAEGPPTGLELEVLERFRGRLPDEIFTEDAVMPPRHSPGQILDRGAIREAGRLLDEAGWTLEGGVRRNAEGEILSVEIIEDSAAMGRIINPFVENLQRVGIQARQTRVDAAQMQLRTEQFDFDIRPARFVMSLTPSLDLRQFFTSDAAETPGSANLSGIADPVVDELVELVIASEDRETLTARVRALDRVLRSMYVWVPHWSKGTHWLAYWDVFGMPDEKPPFSRGDAYWWWDQEKYEALRAAGALR